MNKVRVCPKCGSLNLKNSTLMNSQEISTLPVYNYIRNPELFLCKKCNYFGACPKIKKGDLKKFRSKIKPVKKGIPQISEKRKSFAKVEVILTAIVIILVLIAAFSGNWYIFGIGSLLVIISYFLYFIILFLIRKNKTFIKKT
jgi:hypothetical protein